MIILIFKLLLSQTQLHIFLKQSGEYIYLILKIKNFKEEKFGDLNYIILNFVSPNCLFSFHVMKTCIGKLGKHKLITWSLRTLCLAVPSSTLSSYISSSSFPSRIHPWLISLLFHRQEKWVSKTKVEKPDRLKGRWKKGYSNLQQLINCGSYHSNLYGSAVSPASPEHFQFSSSSSAPEHPLVRLDLHIRHSGHSAEGLHCL